MNTTQRLTRSNTDRIIAGICGGIANYLNVDPTLVRLAFVLLVLFGGVSPIIYLVLWVVLPNENTTASSFEQQLRSNVAEIEQRTTEIAGQVSDQVNQMHGKGGTSDTQRSSQSDHTQQQQAFQLMRDSLLNSKEGFVTKPSLVAAAGFEPATFGL